MHCAKDYIAANGIVDVVYKIRSAVNEGYPLDLNHLRPAIAMLPPQMDLIGRVDQAFSTEDYRELPFYQGKEESGWIRADETYFDALVDQLLHFTTDHGDGTRELLTRAKDTFVKTILKRNKELPPIDPNSECASCPGCQLLLAMTGK